MGAPKSRYSELLLGRRVEEEGPSDEEISDVDEEESDSDAEDDLAAIYKGEIPAAELIGVDSFGDFLPEDDESEDADLLEQATTNGAERKDRKRKRRQRNEDDDLESRHLQKLSKDDREPAEKKRRGEDGSTENAAEEDEEDDDDNATSTGPAIVHESLTADQAAADRERDSRTAFLSNVSAEAIASRKAKKTLLTHLSSALDDSASPPQKIESIRFRSTAFSTAAIPKRAAFIKKSLMDATTKSTNAYVVYSGPAAVSSAVERLNGTVVLDRHLRVDSVARPAAVEHRRCVFVGNLGFVDDESMLDVKRDEDGKEVAEKRKRTKTPMDVEEGLWRVFGKHAGRVESVRVVRDPVTRVGKGFAYVQFYVSYYWRIFQ